MFDAEKLLGKVLQEVMGASHSHKKKGSLLQGLTSGAGLMTAIGLGIGAYEILKEKKSPVSGGQAYSPPVPPPPPGGATAPAWSKPATSTPPPPPPGATPGASPAPPVIAPPLPNSTTTPPGQDLALRLLQVMIAAAHADGNLDEEEEQAILARLKMLS